MVDIYHDFPIHVAPERVFTAVSTPHGLDAWWTNRATGTAAEGESFGLWFGPKYDWQAVVTKCVRPSVFELRMTQADPDWLGTRVGFLLSGRAGGTQVRFYHEGWPSPNDHWRTSCFCWAMYLRVLRRFLEHGEEVEYERRLDV
jgi:uncharacterized protein YndB with AHSA1/START domain